MTTDLAAFAAKRGVKHFMISYTDLFGVQRAKMVPTEAIGQMSKTGAAFAGFATWFDLSAAHPDLLALPDCSHVVQLPWQPEIAWVPANCALGGEEFAQAPRNVLRRLVAAAEAAGLRVRTGVEPEFFLLNAEGTAPHDALDRTEKACYDQQAIMRRYDLFAELMSHMTTMGWRPYQCDHEDAHGQFEMNWGFDDALVTADRHVFFKFMLRSIAERQGIRASFMPKPFAGKSGSGCHVHVSVWDAAGEENLFLDPQAPLALSQLGRHFLGGIVRHTPALAAICNPTANSYRRINMTRTDAGSSWAPASVTWAGNNRTHMVRVPAPGRFEFRLPDSAANPYLLQAAIIAAGLDGVRRSLDPGPVSTRDMHSEGHLVTDAPRLPADLRDALRQYEADTLLSEAMGPEFSSAYLKLKIRECERFAEHGNEWEHEQTLDV
ncbi:type III glutamate--ammonia ligase [Paracoccus cavernae]|uniref:type III glutamate--ammonia ligase n=1 Tax=Paracoccus cavernae TaxID=1571207 RepID=UPI0035F31D47